MPEGSFQVDLSGKFFFDENYWTGLSLRSDRSAVIMAGVGVDRFMFGYAFGMRFLSLGHNGLGSHEFTIIARIDNQIRRYRWLSRF